MWEVCVVVKSQRSRETGFTGAPGSLFVTCENVWWYMLVTFVVAFGGCSFDGLC